MIHRVIFLATFLLVATIRVDLLCQESLIPDPIRSTLGKWILRSVSNVSDSLGDDNRVTIEVNIQSAADSLTVKVRLTEDQWIDDDDSVWTDFFVVPINDVYVRADGWSMIRAPYVIEPYATSPFIHDSETSDSTLDFNYISRVIWFKRHGDTLYYGSIFSHSSFHGVYEDTRDSWASHTMYKSVGRRED